MLACRAFAASVLLAGGSVRRADAFVLERVLLAGVVFGTIGTAFFGGDAVVVWVESMLLGLS